MIAREFRSKTADIISAEEFARRREEREQKRQAREALAGTILAALDDDPPCAPASPAQNKETRP